MSGTTRATSTGSTSGRTRTRASRRQILGAGTCGTAGPPRWWWLALVLTRTQHGTNRAATLGPARRHATASSSSASASASAARAPTSSGSFADPDAGRSTARAERRAGARSPASGIRLLDVPADWELFARGADVVVRIQLALGRITTTPVPGVETDASGGASSSAPTGPSSARWTSIPGYVVRDGKPAPSCRRPCDRSFSMLPGPDQRHLWVRRRPSGLALVTLDGIPTGATIDVPVSGSCWAPTAPVTCCCRASGGVYDARPGAVHRITTGALLASGPTRWLTAECDDSLSCAVVAIDRASGAHHAWTRRSSRPMQNSGTISPDGRTAALQRSADGISSDGIDLLDLDSGLPAPGRGDPERHRPVQGPAWVWSPDSRWLFVADAAGQVMVVNRATGRATPLGMRLPPVTPTGPAPRHRLSVCLLAGHLIRPAVVVQLRDGSRAGR